MREDVNDDGTLKEGAAERVLEGINAGTSSHKDHDDQTALQEAEAVLGPRVADSGTSADDVD